MEPDGEPRGTANTITDGQRIDNTVTDGQRIDRLEDMVREIYHFFSDRYPNGDTPGRSGNFPTGYFQTVESLYETYNVGYSRPIAVVDDSLPWL